MPKSQDLQLRDSFVKFIIFISSQFIKLKSSTHFTEPLSNKKCSLIASSQKDYLQINAFLASGDKIKSNLKAL